MYPGTIFHISAKRATVLALHITVACLAIKVIMHQCCPVTRKTYDWWVKTWLQAAEGNGNWDAAMHV